MSTAFSNALSGLRANADAISVVSGNLANEGTYGYKAHTVSFEELVSQIGGGNSAEISGADVVPSALQTFTQGSIQTTGQPYDAAMQGNGFFVVQDSGGQQAFTRAGNFTLNAQGNLLTQSGEYVQGWNGLDGAVNTNAPLSNITVPVAGLQSPSATTQFSLALNLNAAAVVGSPDATFSSPIQVVDSLGQLHTLTVTYNETAPGTWDYKVTIPGSDLSGGGAPGTVASGTLNFDANGNLTGPAAGSPVAVSITGLADGASDMNLNWNLYNSQGVGQITQYVQTSANLTSSQDGIQPGQLTGIAIGNNGQLIASYSNGKSIAVAQLAVASVLNPTSMQDLGNNTYSVTAATSIPAIGVPGTGSRGTVTGGALESSTVDIATEFTNLLVYERGYQANSKVITTEDQVLQSTLSLITG